LGFGVNPNPDADARTWPATQTIPGTGLSGLKIHPGDNCEANHTFPKSTPAQLYCELQNIHLRIIWKKIKFAVKSPPGWFRVGFFTLFYSRYRTEKILAPYIE
jgi:hypothetical protein